MFSHLHTGRPGKLPLMFSSPESSWDIGEKGQGPPACFSLPPQCPVYDLDNNVAFIGMYQTMTKKAAITVQVGNHMTREMGLVPVPHPALVFLPIPALHEGCLNIFHCDLCA